MSQEAKVKEFIESAGMAFDEAGMPRMAGRILGWLLICDPPHQSAAQLAHHVGGSKGSISTMTRLLISIRLVERLTLPGDRSTHYRMREDAWMEILRLRNKQLRTWRELAEQGLALLNGEPREKRRRLEEMHDLHSFFERQLPVLVARWEQKHEAASGRRRTS
jgi:DNA-binding transcriptional regulator GbsR (MarR family)